MLIKDKNNDFIINMDHVSNLFIEYDSNKMYNLVCTVPSPLGNNGYENFNLISNNRAAAQFHIRRIGALYRQYVVSELGTFIPPKVYEIPSRDESNAILSGNVYIRYSAHNARITADNRVSIGLDIRLGSFSGEILVDGKDYTVTLPLYKGEGEYSFLIYFLQTRTYRVIRTPVDKFKSAGTDVQISTSSD